MTDRLPVCLRLLLRRFITPPRVSSEQPAQDEAEMMPYESSGCVLSPAELAFYLALRPIAGDHPLLIKLRLADLCTIDADPKSRRSWFNRVSSKHVDFLICSKNSLTPRVAIELDDSSHRKKARRERDEFVDSFFKAIRVPLIRVPVADRYDPRELHAAITAALAR